MIDIALQCTGNSVQPYSEADSDAIAGEFKRNQLIRAKLTRVSKGMEPSIEQHGLLHACFKLVFDTKGGDGGFLSPGHVKEACKVGIDFRVKDVVILRLDGGVQFQYRSYSFAGLPCGPERDKVMEQSFEWCARTVGCTVETLIKEAQERMTRRGA